MKGCIIATGQTEGWDRERRSGQAKWGSGIGEVGSGKPSPGAEAL